MSAIYDASRDNLTCLLPVHRPGEMWTRTCRVWCVMCEATAEFLVITEAPIQSLALAALRQAMDEDGWTYGGEQ